MLCWERCLRATTSFAFPREHTGMTDRCTTVQESRIQPTGWAFAGPRTSFPDRAFSVRQPVQRRAPKQAERPHPVSDSGGMFTSPSARLPCSVLSCCLAFGISHKCIA